MLLLQTPALSMHACACEGGACIRKDSTRGQRRLGNSNIEFYLREHNVGLGLRKEGIKERFEKGCNTVFYLKQE